MQNQIIQGLQDHSSRVRPFAHRLIGALGHVGIVMLQTPLFHTEGNAGVSFSQQLVSVVGCLWAETGRVLVG